MNFVKTIPYQNGAELAVQTDVPCHGNSLTESASDVNKPTLVHSHSNNSQKGESQFSALTENCCDVSCQCCVSGCQSVLGGGSDQNQRTSPSSPEDNYSFVVPKLLPSSLFRPPIIS